MNKDNIVDFLKAYAAMAHDGDRYFRDFSPFYSRVSMPGGYAGIEDKNGNCLGSFSVTYDPDGNKLDYSPSMPVNPISMAFLKFVVEAMNAYADILEEKPDADKEVQSDSSDSGS